MNILEDFLYDKATGLITSLPEHQYRLWGSMNATQMLEHLSLTFKASNGLLTAPFTSEPDKAEKLKRIVLLSERPLMKDFNNPVLAQVPESKEVFTHEQAKKRLLENIRLFKQEFEGKNDSYTHMHNIFGPLNYFEWSRFHYKHIHHHFAQFGIIPYVERFELE